MLLLIPILILVLLLLPLWRFLAVFVAVSLGLWSLKWAVTTATPGWGKYVIAIVVVLLAVRAASRLVNR